MCTNKEITKLVHNAVIPVFTEIFSQELLNSIIFENICGKIIASIEKGITYLIESRKLSFYLKLTRIWWIKNVPTAQLISGPLASFTMTRSV